MTIKTIQCTDIGVIEKGILQVECPYCNEIFKALPSAFTPEDYRCPKCNKGIEIKFVAASKEEMELEQESEALKAVAEVSSDPLFDEQKCRVCGCTDDNACPGGCYWVEEDLCSQCAEQG